jgi:hypothetical protein
MSRLSSQDISDLNLLPIESFVLVCSFDYDCSVDLDTGIKAARLEVREDRSAIDV